MTAGGRLEATANFTGGHASVCIYADAAMWFWPPKFVMELPEVQSLDVGGAADQRKLCHRCARRPPGRVRAPRQHPDRHRLGRKPARHPVPLRRIMHRPALRQPRQTVRLLIAHAGGVPSGRDLHPPRHHRPGQSRKASSRPGAPTPGRPHPHPGQPRHHGQPTSRRHVPRRGTRHSNPEDRRRRQDHSAEQLDQSDCSASLPRRLVAACPNAQVQRTILAVQSSNSKPRVLASSTSCRTRLPSAATARSRTARSSSAVRSLL